jgi:hypothetical protein
VAFVSMLVSDIITFIDFYKVLRQFCKKLPTNPITTRDTNNLEKIK